MRFSLFGIALACLVSLFATAARADKVLLIGSGDPSNDAAIASILQSQGNTVTIGPTFNNFTGSGLAGYNDVMLLPNAPWQSPYSAFNLGDMPASGQQSLVNFVNSGGGLITSEWIMQKNAIQNDFTFLLPALPIISSAHYTNVSPITFTALTNNAVMNANLPTSFSFQTGNQFGSETYYVPKPGATAFYATNQWLSPSSGTSPAEGVVGWSFGGGRVISFSTPLDTTSLQNTNFAQLVNNAVAWAGGQGPPSGPTMGPYPPLYPGAPFVPEPTTVAVWGTGLFAVALVSRVRRRKPPAPCAESRGEPAI